MVKRILKKIVHSLGYDVQRIQGPLDGINKAEVNTKWLVELEIATILDIGANEGQFAKKIRGVFPNSKIYSFEPLLDTYLLLKKNFEKDALFEAFNCALGEKEGEATIFLNEYSPSSSLLKLGDEHKKHFDFARKEI